jgi:hypothetical protein
MAQEGRKGTRGFADGPVEAIRALIEVHRHLGPGSWNLRYEARVCAELGGTRLTPDPPKILPLFRPSCALEVRECLRVPSREG